ncbi:MAG TPA: hypothetical protein PKC19_18300, partial [Roseiflexaceae bacterium]|nr:hypothetical protein [Roseiflexaceae bacterium]
MNNTVSNLRDHRIRREVGFYALYIALIALTLFVGLIIWRQALQFVFYGPIDFGWWARFLYMFSVVSGSIVMVLGILIAEPYLNTGKQRGELMQRFWRIAIPVGLFGILGY